MADFCDDGASDAAVADEGGCIWMDSDAATGSWWRTTTTTTPMLAVAFGSWAASDCERSVNCAGNPEDDVDADDDDNDVDVVVVDDDSNGVVDDSHRNAD